MIIKASIQDSEVLTNIALTSKAHWGYSKKLIESWRSELTVSYKMIEEMIVFKITINNHIAGFYALNPPKENAIELEMLFILPKFIRQGIGKKLLLHSIKKSKELKADSMTLLADPNAVPFYKSEGFAIIDKKESSIPNRFLPIMQKNLTR